MNKIKTIWEKISRKIIVYQCDNCEKILSDGKIAKPHLSIKFAEYSGWVSDHISRWRHDFKVRGIRQFCGTACMERFFIKLKCPKIIKEIGRKKN